MFNFSEIIDKLDEVDIKLNAINNNEIADVLIELSFAIDLITEQLQIMNKNNK